MYIWGQVWGPLISQLKCKFSPRGQMYLHPHAGLGCAAGLACAGLKQICSAGLLPCWPFCAPACGAQLWVSFCPLAGNAYQPVLSPSCSFFVHRVACVGGSCQKQTKQIRAGIVMGWNRHAPWFLSPSKQDFLFVSFRVLLPNYLFFTGVLF
jgi:hypothetical protein